MEYLIEECNAAEKIDWKFFSSVINKREWAIAELILYHNNALADGTTFKTDSLSFIIFFFCIRS